MSNLLAGPIVRRTESHRVAIWIVTEQEQVFSGTAFQKGDDGALSELTIQSTQRTAKLGSKLFVHIIWLSWAEAIAENTIVYYDLFKDGSSLLGGNTDFCFPHEPYPSFVSPGKLNNVLHGSCRKPHAGATKKAWGSQDQLATAAKIVGGHLADPLQRPSMLLLTGDQIYADDVGGPMLAHLIPLAQRVTGWNEVMPRRRPAFDGALHTQNDAKSVNTVELYRRACEVSFNLSARADGFSSSKAQNHLMTFGEYAAMYLTVFGGAGAAPVFPAWKQVFHHKWMGDHKSTYKQEKKRLKVFAGSLADVRRLLANISVYMQFDDHEVTDDWNISQPWVDGVKRSPRTKRVTANALAAYWAFQGWGNDPDRFSEGFVQVLEEHLNSFRHDGDVAEEYDQLLWSSNPGRWSYSTPTVPSVIAMDTRTCRKLGQGGQMAKLMNEAALDELVNEVKKAVQTSSGVCIISPTPVLGLRFVEGVQGLALSLAKIIPGAMTALDVESWVGGYSSLETALLGVLNLKQIVFLSGDVHYSFARTANMGRKIKVLQLTSSPQHNTSVGLQIGEQSELVEGYHFIASDEQVKAKHVAITGLNNIAQVCFNPDGSVEKQELHATLADGSEYKLTFTM